MGESNNHKVESFFLDNFSIDRLFDRIERTDYVFLYYIRYCEEQNQSDRVYLANLAQVMNIKMPQLSKGIETLQSKGYVTWKTDHELGKTYVEITPRASELMVKIRQRIEECYAHIKEEIGEEEMERTRRRCGEFRRLLGIRLGRPSKKLENIRAKDKKFAIRSKYSEFFIFIMNI